MTEKRKRKIREITSGNFKLESANCPLRGEQHYGNISQPARVPDCEEVRTCQKWGCDYSAYLPFPYRALACVSLL